MSDGPRLPWLDRLLWRLVRALLAPDERDDFRTELLHQHAACVESDPGAAGRWVRRELVTSAWPLAMRSLVRMRRGTWDDGRQALRALRGGRVVAVQVALTLAMGVGAAATVFGVLRAVLLEPLPYPQPEQLHVVATIQPERGSATRGVSGPDYYDLVETVGSDVELGAFDATPRTVTGLGLVARRVEVAATNRAAFSVAGVQPLLGRTFSEAEDSAEPRDVVLLSERAWRELFGSDPAADGRSVRIDGRSHTVIGVMPAYFQLPAVTTDMWTPLGDSPRQFHRRAGVLDVVFRARSPEARDLIARRITSEYERLAAEYPETNRGREPVVLPLTDALAGEDGRALLILLIGSLSLLAVAFLNSLGLLASRLAARRTELELRVALGAPRYRIRRQLFVEATVMIAFGVVVGLALALVGLSAATVVWPADTFRAEQIAFEPTVAVFACALGAVMALVVPWVQRGGLSGSVARSRGGRWGAGVRGREVLLFAQLTTVLVLVSGSVTLLRGLAAVTVVERGLDTEALLVGRLNLPAERYPTGMARYPEWPEVHRFHAELLDRLLQDPAVQTAALAGSDPLARPSFNIGMGLRSPTRSDTVEAAIQMVSPDWRRVVGLELLTGRDLGAADTERSEPVVVVNEAFARTFLQDAALDAMVRYLGADRRIVGVVEDIVPAPGLSPQPTVYSPLTQTPSEYVTAVVRPRAAPAEAVGVVRAAVADVDPEVAVYDERPLATELDAALARPRLNATVVGTFGVLGLLLAAVGVFALLSETVASSRRALGIRLALGASGPEIVRAAIGRPAFALFASVGVGAIATLGSTPLLRQLAPDAVGVSGAALVASVGVLLAAATLASVPPVARAIRIDPMRSLRPERD